MKEKARNTMIRKKLNNKLIASFIVFLLLVQFILPFGYVLAADEVELSIGTKDELFAFARRVNNGENFWGKTVELTANIDLANQEWTPIGDNTKQFCGIFEGNGYTIRGLTIHSSRDNDRVGLFGGINTASGGGIRNLTITNGTISSTGNASIVGGIVANLGASLLGDTAIGMQNCQNIGVNIQTQNALHVGGLVGSASANIMQSSNQANVDFVSSENGGLGVGGIVGHFYGDTISKCYNKGTVTEQKDSNAISGLGTGVGGIVGSFESNNAVRKLTYSYNAGNISGDHPVGGIVGSVNGTTASVENTYNIGKITSTRENNLIGAIIGTNGDTTQSQKPGGTITNSYYLQGTAAVGCGDNSQGSVSTTEKSSSEMKTQEFVHLLDSSGKIFIYDDKNENSGYPILAKPEKTIQLADQKLYQAIIEILGNKVKNKNDSNRSFTISEADLMGITTLDLSSKGINKLGGIENFTELKKLNLYKNNINDVTPILSLTKLTELNVEGNSIKNLPTFSELTKLTTLHVGFQRFQEGVVGLYGEQETVTLPETIQKALNASSPYYAGDQIDFGNCELGQDGKSIVFDPNVAANYGVMLKITGGKLKDTYYYVNGISVNYVLDSTEEDLPNLDLDLNSDGTINQDDAEMIRKWYQGQTLTEQEQSKISQMDLNRDGYINVLDYHRFKNYVTHQSTLLSSYPIVPEGTTKETIIAEVVTNEEGLDIAQTHVFEQNGQHEFIITIQNIEFTLLAKVDCIEKEELTYQTYFSTTDPTNQDVTVTIATNHELIDQYYITSEEGEEVFDSGWRLAEDKKSITKTFTENTVEDVPLSDTLGNNVITTVTITNITRETPESATLMMKQGEEEYQTGKWTNEEVTVSLDPDSIQSGLTAYYTINEEGHYTEETTLSEEGSYQILVKTVDAAGNTATKEYTVLIDKTVPQAGNLVLKANSSTGDRLENEVTTNQNVHLSIEGGSDAFSGIDRITYSINGGEEQEDSQIVRLEGTYHIQVKTYDKAGNTVESTYSFTIDKTVPQLSVTYERLDDGTVNVQILSDKPMKAVDGWTLSADKKVFTKQYNKNTQETIELEDLVGNTVEAEISVTGIQVLDFLVDVSYTPDGKTNQNVTAIIKANQEMKALAGWTLSSDKREMRKTYHENSEESLTITSVTNKNAYIRIKVDQIDREAPAIKVLYSNTQNTKEDVTVTLMAGERLQALSGWTLSQNQLSLTKTFSANETKTYVVKDIAGNETTCLVGITWIDKQAPILRVSYDITEPTQNPVKVTIHSNEPVQPVNGWTTSLDQLTLSKTYTKNTEENVTVSDLVGNKATAQVNVQNIQKEEQQIPEDTAYQVTSDDYIMGIDPNTTSQEFIQKLGITVDLGQETRIKTGMKITVGSKSYTLVVKGDISQDGIVDTMDLSSLVLALGGYSSHTLTGAKQKAADVNLDGEIDMRDLSKLSLTIAGY